MKIARSGRKYAKIAKGYNVEQWDKMTILERIKASGLLKERKQSDVNFNYQDPTGK